MRASFNKSVMKGLSKTGELLQTSITIPVPSVFKPAIRLTKKFCIASVVTVSAILLAPEHFISSSVEDFVEDNNLPPKILNGVATDDIRVYRRNPIAAIHIPLRRVFHTLKQAGEDKSALEKAKIGVGFFIAIYPELLKDSIKDTIEYPPLNASILMGKEEGDTHYIRPPKNLSAKELVAELTQIPSYHLPDLQVTNSFATAIVLLHEIGHAQPNLEERKKLTEIEWEALADFFAYSQMKKQYPNNPISNITRHARAIAPFSSRSFFDHTHAVALDTDARLAGKHECKTHPLSSDINATNKTLRILSRMHYMDNNSGEGDEHFVGIKKAMEIAATNPLHDPLFRRAAELYIEGLDYFENYEEIEQAFLQDPAQQLKHQIN